jgi:hypothetical protein
MGVVPVLHVVLLGHARRPGIADVVVAQEVLDLLRCVAVDEEEPPYLGLVRALRVPHRQRARLPGKQRRIGEDLAGRADQPAVGARTPPPLLLAMAKILSDLRRILIGGLRLVILGQHIGDRLVPAIGNRDLQPAAPTEFAVIAPAAPTWADADKVDRAVRDVVVGVTAEILRWPLPVARNDPLLHAAQ